MVLNILLKYLYFQLTKLKNCKIFYFIAICMPIGLLLNAILCDFIFNASILTKAVIMIILLLIQIGSMSYYFYQSRKGYL